MFFGEDTCDRSQTPILVWLVKLGRSHASIVQLLPKLLELVLVLDRQVNVAWVTIDRPAKLICVFNSGVTGLNSLLRKWEVFTRNGVEVRLWCFCFNLKLRHDISLVC